MAKRSAKRSPKTDDSLSVTNGAGAGVALLTPEPASTSSVALWLQVGNRQFWLGIAFLILLTLLQFGGVLFTSAHPVLGSIDADGTAAEGPVRAFITRSMHGGVFPLWNPHIFSGQPFFTAGQAPLLYPPTWLHRVMPLDKAIDTILALHVFLAGLGMYLWACRQKMRPASALVAAVTVMFGGPLFLQVYACHIENVSAMAWTPFLFLAVDMVLDRLYWEGLLVGAFTFGMEILAGQPQYMFYAVVALAIYAVVKLIRAAEWPKKLGILAAAAAVGVGFSGFQLMLVLPQVQESIRRAGAVPRDFAAMFSFPPENLLTMIAPGIFGNEVGMIYWGRCYLWEMSLFMGVSGLCLALCGLLAPTDPPYKRKWIWGGMAVILFVLAIGSHTPLFDLLYQLPGFNKFRGLSKFAFDCSLFVALLAAAGFDSLTTLAARAVRKNADPGRTVALAAFALALLAGGIGLALHAPAGHAPDWWKSQVAAMLATGEVDPLVTAQVQSAGFPGQSAAFVSTQLLIAAALLAVAAGLLFVSRKAWSRYALLAMVCCELFVFAHQFRATVDLTTITNPQAAQFIKDNPGDYRMLNLKWPNLALTIGAHDISGYDSFRLQRYAEFITYSQGLDLTYDNLMEGAITRSGPLFRLLRVRYILEPDASGNTQTFRFNTDLPHLLLVNRYTVMQGRDNILPALVDKSFDPTSQIILESAPVPPPVDNGNPGTVQLMHEDANSLTIDANLSHAAILLITDSYSRGWKAVALPGSAQSAYQVLPADYTLRAIPLSAGVHHIRVEFDPPGMRVGLAISALSLAVYLFLLFRFAVMRLSRHSSPSAK